MGSPKFAVASLEALVQSHYDITAVYAQPDKKAGRGQQVMSCAVKKYAVSRGLSVIEPETFTNPAEIERFKTLNPDIVIVAAYGLILPEEILHLPRYGFLNVHPSLLPAYRGPSPVAAAILNGDKITGVSIMLVEKKVDSGPVLSQREMTIDESDTAETLSEKLARLGAELLIETIPGWISGKIVPQVQDENKVSYTKMETREDGAIDWSIPAVEIWRRVRAYHPWPGCYTTWKGERLKILRAVPLLGLNEGKVGEVKILPRTATARVAIQTGEGMLGLIDVQPEGKRKMSAAEFLAGHRDFAGSVL